MELAIKTARARQTARWRQWIIIAGSILNLACFPVAVIIWAQLEHQTWARQVWPFLVALPSFTTGALVAFLGMAMTGQHRDIAEWGARVPLTCLLYGSIPYMVFFLIKPDLFLMMAGIIAAGAILNLAGGMIIAAAAKRWFLGEG